MIPAEQNNRQIYTVGSLTREIKSLIEDRFPFLWVTGEISNYVVPSSGHSYFSLKDNQAVISCVMFKNQKRRLPFNPENGMKVTGMARVSLYEPRGSYQLIFEHLAPDGAGSLQASFEQLKKKLASQGLFDQVHKKDIPFLPGKINVITSGTGAAVRDIIHVATRRFPGCCLEIVPVKVQGETAEPEIVQALNMVNKLNRSDLIILARGGGSIEDLMAFNSETVARAVFDSKIPVITGIGHETDFTIADFVSDLRAPTPSAAAEMALPDKAALVHQVNGYHLSLYQRLTSKLDLNKQYLNDLRERLKSPDRIVDDFRLRIEEFQLRMETGLKNRLQREKDKLFWLKHTLHNGLPPGKIKDLRTRVQGFRTALNQAMAKQMTGYRFQAKELDSKLCSLNPAAVLDRGYSISRNLSTGAVLLDAQTVKTDDQVEIILSKGRLVTRVE